MLPILLLEVYRKKREEIALFLCYTQQCHFSKMTIHSGLLQDYSFIRNFSFITTYYPPSNRIQGDNMLFCTKFIGFNVAFILISDRMLYVLVILFGLKNNYDYNLHFLKKKSFFSCILFCLLITSK